MADTLDEFGKKLTDDDGQRREVERQQRSRARRITHTERRRHRLDGLTLMYRETGGFGRVYVLARYRRWLETTWPETSNELAEPFLFYLVGRRPFARRLQAVRVRSGILPLTVLRRLDCVLEPAKAAVLVELDKRTKAKVNPEPFLLKKSKQLFYNTSPLDIKKLMGDQDNIAEKFFSYIQAFSADVRDIFECFDFHLSGQNPDARLVMYGQELNAESYAKSLHPPARNVSILLNGQKTEEAGTSWCLSPLALSSVCRLMELALAGMYTGSS